MKRKARKTNIIFTEKFISKTQAERTEAVRKTLVRWFVRDMLSGKEITVQECKENQNCDKTL